jgi:hypothetical protein
MQPGELAQQPYVPINIPMGEAEDMTTNVAPLPIFYGRPGSDPDWHMSQFLTASVANNGRTEELWLRWFPATLKDVAFEWYNRQPTGHFANWNALRTAFLDHFRPIGFEDRLRNQLISSKMNPGETVDAYFGRVADVMRKWPNNALPDPFVISILVAGLSPPELKMFVKEARPVTWVDTLNRAKVWEECHYDQYLMTGGTMIPSDGGVPVPQWNAAMSNPQQSTVPMITSGDPRNTVLNVVPLQSRPPVPNTGNYGQYPNQYQSGQPQQMNPTMVVPMNSNEAILLNLTKQMEVLASNIAKDKDKKNKGNASINNLWCTNCKGHGHQALNCPSPNNMKVQCKNCGKAHPTEECWYLSGNRPNGPNMIIPNSQFDVNQVQGEPRFGWNGQRPSNNNWNGSRNIGNNRYGGYAPNSYQRP